MSKSTDTTASAESNLNDGDHDDDDDDDTYREGCAINLFGLPRAFQSLVLPSFERNVIVPNAMYECDYYVHYFFVEQETAGRSGAGGRIDPKEVLLLEERVRHVARSVNASRVPRVMFNQTTDPEFLEQYKDLIHKIETEKDDKNRSLYFPWQAKSYSFPATVHNILRQWHSVQSAWELMEQSGKQNKVNYTRVAMFRNDVVYPVSLDIFQKPDLTQDVENQYALVPAFGMYPVSDRGIYGPAPAVRIWSTIRFARLHQHVQQVLGTNNAGWAMHSERFMNWTIFPAIRRETNVTLAYHPTMCFFRARADETVWINDCNKEAAKSVVDNLGADTKKVTENAIGRKCGEAQLIRWVRAMSLNCSTLLNASPVR